MKTLQVFACVLAVFLISVMSFSKDIQGAEEKNSQEQVASIRHEVSLINLVNGLNFTEEQLNQLISILKEVQTLNDTCRENVRLLSMEEAKECDKIRKILLEHGPNIDTQEGKKAGEIKEKIEKLHEELQAKLSDYQNKIENVLTKAQKEVIGTFKNCLIPIPSLRNPVRVGQTANTDGELNALKRLRSAPAKNYAKMKKQMLERKFAKFEEKYGKLTEEEKTAERKRLTDIMDKTRAMSNEDFEINKEELATDFQMKNKVEELSSELQSLTAYRKQDKPKLNKTGKYFLDPVMLGVLETKLISVKNFKPVPQKDLDEANADKKEK